VQPVSYIQVFRHLGRRLGVSAVGYGVGTLEVTVLLLEVETILEVVVTGDVEVEMLPVSVAVTGQIVVET